MSGRKSSLKAEVMFSAHAAAAAAVNPPGRTQHCGAAAPAQPRPARPSCPSRLRAPAPPPRAALRSRPAGPAPLPGPAGRPRCPDEAGRGGLDRPAAGRPCRTSALPPTAHGRARSLTWPSSGSRGTRPDARSGLRIVGEQT